jgi:UDP-N-acetylmuramoyl-tripeptide--D-alanyl-D-alanine ligase
VGATGAEPGRATGVTTDSRTVQPGDLFVALRGPRFDGHDFVETAFAAGAFAALVEDDGNTWSRPTVRVKDTLSALGALGRWWRLERGIPILGLTGSNGKTSTKELAAALLRTRVEALRTEGNLNNRIGVPMTLLGLTDRHATAVVEMGMNQRGEIADLTRICVPDVALLLNVGPAHIGELGSLEAIAEAKAEMLHHAPATSTLVVNADDPRVMQHARAFERRRLRTFGESDGVDVRLIHREVHDAGQRLDVVVDGAPHRLELGLLGRHSALNAIAALAGVTALPESVRPSSSLWAEAWKDLAPPAGRFVVRRVGGLRLVDDAYNANPGSFSTALSTVAEIRGDAPFGVVLGEMQELGVHSESAHREAGEAVARAGAAFFATLGAGARPAAEAARAAGVPVEHADEDLEAIFAFVQHHLKSDSVLLLKGSRKARLERLVARLEAH